MSSDTEPELSGKGSLVEHSIEPGVFQDMDKFEMSDAEKFALSVRFQFPKFSKGFSVTDFESFVDAHIGLDNLASIGRLAFPNEWQVQVKCQEIREKLIRMGRTKINTRTCWISPLSPSEVRGYVHWLPNAVNVTVIEDLLKAFGDILFIEVQKVLKWNRVESDSRYFAMNLKPGRTMDDIPHFFVVSGHNGLITIKGRRPACFHCKEIGHRKSECKKYREKLSDYCLRKSTATTKRKVPRGLRYKPVHKLEDQQDGEKKKRKRKNKSAKTQMKNLDKALQTEISLVSDGSVGTQENSVISKSIDIEDMSSEMKKLQIHQNLEALKTAFSSLLNAAATNVGTNIESMKQSLVTSVDTPSVLPANLTSPKLKEAVSGTVDSDKSKEIIPGTPADASKDTQAAGSKKKKRNKKKAQGVTLP